MIYRWSTSHEVTPIWKTDYREYEYLENLFLFFVEFVENIKLWHKWFCLRIYDLFWCHLSISYQNMINLSLSQKVLNWSETDFVVVHICAIFYTEDVIEILFCVLIQKWSSFTIMGPLITRLELCLNCCEAADKDWRLASIAEGTQII